MCRLKLRSLMPKKLTHPLPTAGSWLNLVERWFQEITDKRIRSGAFRNVQQLVDAITAYVDEHNENPRSFT